MSVAGPALEELLNAFRAHYRRYEHAVHEAVVNPTDAVVLWRLGDDLDQYIGLVNEHSTIFSDDERNLILQNVATMQNDVRLEYQRAVDQSHRGRPTVVETIHTGAPGRPAVAIDPDFLRWAYSLRSTASIARFLGLSRTVVRQALLEHGIARPRQQPSTLAAFNEPSTLPSEGGAEYLIDPEQSQVPTAPLVSSFTGPLSEISDDELDGLLIRLRTHYRRAGITMFDGMLRRLGHHVPRERIRQALIRDLILSGIMMANMDLSAASNNNRGQTVLDLFLAAAAIYGIPSRLRGDHGVENLLVAAYMEAIHGEGRGSYIWGRSVHNVRIEHLWADITAQIGATWADLFTLLEVRHGLDINNACHIWLLHYLFLHQINEQLRFFLEAWNQHQIRIRDGPNRSPADMFGFDMHVHGVRGTDLMTTEELEVFGVDWEALNDDAVLESRQDNNPSDEGSTSWVGHSGPPARLNEISVEPPVGPFTDAELQLLDNAVGHLAGAVEDDAATNLWMEALIAARLIRNDLF
ncbi:hypothetical protein MVEN_01404900 [Mycena venus]|uniref:Integrase core domain-containing protein n=1 Tax=Mycena venus TaxID=2733690 RepID=A0A8H7CSM3_9AGAR|nr:hypothetical protein MVEN_01404900 [Mycena venus]